MNKQAAMIKELQRRGKDPSEPLDRKDWDKARLTIRTPAEIARDGGKQIRAKAERRFKLHQVSDSRAMENLTICRANKCGSYGILSNGDDVCWRCTCAGGKELHTKAKSSREACPHVPPLWTNRSDISA